MDKNFTVDDIINEYSGKTTGRHVSDESLDLDALIKDMKSTDRDAVNAGGSKPGHKTEIIEDVLEIGDNSYVFDPGDSEYPSDGEENKAEREMPTDESGSSAKETAGGISNTEIISELLKSADLKKKDEPSEPEIMELDFGLRHAKETVSGTGVLEQMLDENPHEAAASHKDEQTRQEKPAAEGPRTAEEIISEFERFSSSKQNAGSAAEDVKKAPEEAAGREPEKNEQETHEQKIRPVEESIKRTEPPLRPIKENGSNTAIMEGLLKLKKERGTKRRESKVPPINRANIDDIDLDIDSKIIPNTEVGLDENATEEERLQYLNAKRRERVKQFVISGEEEEPKKKKDDVQDFMNFEQAKEMAGGISSLKASLAVRMCVLLVAALVSGYIAVANDFGLPMVSLLSKSENQGMPYLFVNVIIGLMACFVSYTVIAVGLKKLFTLKADSDSLAAVSSILSIGAGIALLTDTELVQLSVANIYICVSVIGLLVNTLGKLLIVSRTEKNFEYISGGYSKYAVMKIEDEELASKFTKGALTDFPSLATSRKTEFVSDFIKNSYSADMTDSFCKYFVPIITAVSAVVGVISAFLHPAEINTGIRMLIYGLSCAAGAYAVCSAAGMMLVTNIPLAKGSKKYMQQSAVMLGYSAVDQFADVNSVLIDAIDLFPDGMVEIVNIKPTKKTPIEDGIIYAASLCCQTESILRPTFYKMIKGKTEMLFPVESYLYEDGLGLLGWIQNKRVLFGNRALMESHSIDGLPTAEKEAQYLKDGTNLQYLSIGGSLAMIFVIRLKASVNIAKALKECESQNITVILRSVDSLLSISRIAELFSVAPNMFKLLPFRFHEEYDQCTSYVEKMSSPMIYSGHFASLAALLTGTKRIQKSSAVGIILQTLSAVLGVILSVVLSLVGIFTSTMNASAVIIYTLVFVLLTAIVQGISKT